MLGAINANAGDCQHRSSMRRAASSRPVHSVARGQHYTGRSISASMVGISINVSHVVVRHSASMVGISTDVSHAVVVNSASMASRSIHVGSAVAQPSASMMYKELVARRASLWAT